MTKEKFLEKFALCEVVLVDQECYIINDKEKINSNAKKIYEILKQVIKMANVRNITIVGEGRINEDCFNCLEVGFTITLYFDKYEYLDYETCMVFGKEDYEKLVCEA